MCIRDRVTHRAFGSGVVSKIQPMGGDALLEVEFETAGTKPVSYTHLDVYKRQPDSSSCQTLKPE